MENNSFKKFRLSGLRRENNLNSRDLEKLLNVSQPTITRRENGLQEHSKKNVKKLTSNFNVYSNYRLGLTDEREPYKKPMKFEEALKILENTKRNNDMFTITDNIKNLSDEQLQTIATIVKSFTKK